eukprot:11206743-Lingulodinium_polyedra.AAC.1
MRAGAGQSAALYYCGPRGRGHPQQYTTAERGIDPRTSTAKTLAGRICAQHALPPAAPSDLP